EDTIGSLNRADGQGSEETPAFVSPCGRRTTTAPQEQSDHFLFAIDASPVARRSQNARGNSRARNASSPVRTARRQLGATKNGFAHSATQVSIARTRTSASKAASRQVSWSASISE